MVIGGVEVKDEEVEEEEPKLSRLRELGNNVATMEGMQSLWKRP